MTVTQRLTWEISQTLFRSSYRSKSWDGIKDKLCKLFQLIGVLIICSVSKFWMYLFQQSKEKAEHGQHELGRWDQRRRQHPSIQLQKQSFIPGMATRTNFFCFVFGQAFLDISEKTQGQKTQAKNKLMQTFKKLKQIIQKLNNLPTLKDFFAQKSPEVDIF